ncbi:alpha/beta fold hydrolase [Emcibacter nanhaiensis]|uniref:Alpha/beta fold hydrolase n=1 Tax=Emcibacter nanhaiensis TaxID=1505037 RepID=A0A501PI86_9PROT|nr:alpha/beta hydrolase [Emcibacter nanhaiensis]TPD60180.1 alpha/beta fold hydrolase [Emcibacter nanhaiensis]
MENNPEIGQKIETCGYLTNYHDAGEGDVVILLHGSGAGVSGWANWRGMIPLLSTRFRVIVPDLVGFGYTETPGDFEFDFMSSWIDQIVALMDGLGLEKAHLVGNSFGGSLSMWLASQYPDRFGRLVLMGPGGWPLEVNSELEELWGYTPSVENMKRIMDIMAYDRGLVTDELAELRYRATIRPGAQETFERVFPVPRQRWLDAQVLSVAQLQNITHETLLIHGRDDIVVSPEVSLNLHRHIRNSQLHMFGNCGHWTQIEHAARFNQLVQNFLDEE